MDSLHSKQHNECIMQYGGTHTCL